MAQAVFFMPGLLLLPILSMGATLLTLGAFAIVAAYLTTPDPVLIVEAINELTAYGATLATSLANEGLDAAHELAQQGDVALGGAPSALRAPSLAIDTGLHPQLLQSLAVTYEVRSGPLPPRGSRAVRRGRG